MHLAVNNCRISSCTDLRWRSPQPRKVSRHLFASVSFVRMSFVPVISSVTYARHLWLSASKHALGQKLSKSGKGKGRPQTQASRTAACKPEAETEASSCGKTKIVFTSCCRNFIKVMTVILQEMKTMEIIRVNIFTICISGEETDGLKGNSDMWVVYNKLNELQILDFCFVCLCEFHCRRYDVDMHVSVADTDTDLHKDAASKDDPSKLVHKPKTKTYAELTALHQDFHHDEC